MRPICLTVDTRPPTLCVNINEISMTHIFAKKRMVSINNEESQFFETSYRSVAAYLRGMRPTSPIDKDIPTINEKLKTQNYNINRTHK